LVKSKQSEIQDDVTSTQNGQSSFVNFGLRDYGSALSNLCHEFLDFERVFGSDESFHQASKIVSGKLRSLGSNQGDNTGIPSGQVTSSAPSGSMANEVDSMEIDAAQSVKRKARELDATDGTDSAEPSAAKRARSSPSAMAEVPTSNGEDADKRTNLKAPKKIPEHTVVVGKLEYPAHPFTISVSNLAVETEDMDLVDAFAPTCGAIVHARILREKHHGPRHIKAKSKGMGLIQFEERESVEKALALNDEIGLHEKLVKVCRSHMPAVSSKVPPGMHRTNPQGKGKSSKRNQKRREARAKDEACDKGGEDPATNVEKGKESAGKPKPVASASASSLSFIPRGLHGKKHHKVKIDLEKK
jgi:RNA recognition motif-containing protein